MRRRRSPRGQMPRDTGPKVNRDIRARFVTVIDEEGKQLGKFETRDAVQFAQERGLDLIEVQANADPPVCRIGDWGKMKFERQKKAREARKNQKGGTMKELKVRPKTDDHDMDFKIKKAREFLKEGNKVKVTVWFRGREHAHHDIGADQCLRIAEAVEELGKIERMPSMEGRRMHMILAPV